MKLVVSPLKQDAICPVCAKIEYDLQIEPSEREMNLPSGRSDASTHWHRTVPSPRPQFWFDLVVIPIVEIRPSAHILPLWLAYFHHSVVSNSAVCGAVCSEMCTVRAHSPHSGYSRARPRPGSHHGGIEPPDCWPGYQMGQKATIVPKPRHEAASPQAMFHDMFLYQSGVRT